MTANARPCPYKSPTKMQILLSSYGTTRNLNPGLLRIHYSSHPVSERINVPRATIFKAINFIHTVYSIYVPPECTVLNTHEY
jgi:hypothetical protein